ncbi:MAG: hypothetical protein Q9184_001257 [Pyrenodesmia sp. 2 TL-2023]
MSTPNFLVTAVVYTFTRPIDPDVLASAWLTTPSPLSFPPDVAHRTITIPTTIGPHESDAVDEANAAFETWKGGAKAFFHCKDGDDRTVWWFIGVMGNGKEVLEVKVVRATLEEETGCLRKGNDLAALGEGRGV